MASTSEALSNVLGGTRDVQFILDVLKQYREVRKVYHYDYTEDDKAALQACATDLRPFSHSFLPAGALYWGLGKMVKNPKQLGGLTRAALVVLRLGAAAEVFRLGYLVGSYKQGMDCTRRLASLRSPLGGEIVSIIRARDPDHPLLRYERPPAELFEDGSRPRIVSEANRLAKIEHFRRELAQARAGREVDRANDRADERLYSILRQREEVLDEIHKGGGPAAAASAGSLQAMRPAPPRSYQEEYAAAGTAGLAGAAGVSAAMGGGSLASAARTGRGHSGVGAVLPGGGLVIHDEPLPQHASAAAGSAVGQVQAAPLQAARPGSSTEDSFAMLLVGEAPGWGAAEGSAEDRVRAAEEEEQQRRRRDRRKAWWWRHGGRGDGAPAP